MTLRKIVNFLTVETQERVSRKFDVVICGAGIAGVSAAYHLVRAGIKDILVIDPLPPLSLTSNMSTEGYRNWWPDPEMLALMNRSIDILERLREESGNLLRMNRRGYLYLISDESHVAAFRQRAEHIASLGAGPLRVHTSPDSDYQPREAPGASGADLLLGPDVIRKHYPYVTERVVAGLHARRAGWLSAQQLGIYLLDCARKQGMNVERGQVDAVDTDGGRVRAVRLGSGERVECAAFVDAAGPYVKRVGALLGVDIPVETELHLKVTFNDALGVVDRGAPLLIWDEPQRLPWQPDEIESLRADPETRWLTEELPAGAHVRPEGSGESRSVMMLWDYKSRWMEPVFPPPLDELYPELVLRGLANMLPGLARYFDRSPRPYMDGGYYVKTRENRLLAGPLPVQGAFVIGGLSGFGIMSSCAAGELLAAHLSGHGLPPYAAAFSLARYEDPGYRARLATWDLSGEL